LSERRFFFSSFNYLFSIVEVVAADLLLLSCVTLSEEVLPDGTRELSQLTVSNACFALVLLGGFFLFSKAENEKSGVGTFVYRCCT
jgi:hypothetical protein